MPTDDDTDDLPLADLALRVVDDAGRRQRLPGGGYYHAATVRRLIAEHVAAAAGKEMEDTRRLDAMDRQRIGVTPEFQGGWNAERYDESGAARAIYGGCTSRDAIDAAMQAERGEEKP